MKTSNETSIDYVQAAGMKAISWGAIFSGIAIAAALYIVLMVLGAGLGLAVMSPWNLQEYAPETIGTAAVIWIILTQIISSGGGGYIAGRLAMTESETDNQEGHFRSTIHGLVLWALTSIIILLLMGTTVSNMFSGGVSVISTISKGAGLGAGAGAVYLGKSLHSQLSESDADEESVGIDNYALDLLFRPLWSGTNSNEQRSAPKSSDTSSHRTEVARIFAYVIQEGNMSDQDKHYVAQIISMDTGLSQADALNRVNETLNQIQNMLKTAKEQAQQTLDSVRRATIGAALWTFAALFGGALSAGTAARYGGSNWGRRIAKSS